MNKNGSNESQSQQAHSGGVDEWVPLLTAWWTHFGDEPVTVDELRVGAFARHVGEQSCDPNIAAEAAP